MDFTKVLQRVGELMTKIIPVQNPGADWDLNKASFEELINLQQNGIDVSEQLALYEQGIHPNQIQEELEIKLNQLRFEDVDIPLDKIPNPTNLDLLSPHFNNLSLQSKFIQDNLKVPTSSKKLELFKEELKSAKIIYTSVVQAAPQMWDENAEIGYAYMVLVSIEKGEFLNNIKLLKQLALALNEFRDIEQCPSLFSKEMKKLHKNLNNPNSSFSKINLDDTFFNYFQVNFGDTQINNEAIFVGTKGTTAYAKDNFFPKKSIPTNGIIPYIALNNQESYDRDFKEIKGSYYQ